MLSYKRLLQFLYTVALVTAAVVLTTPGSSDAQDVTVANGLAVIKTSTGLYWSALMPPAPDAGTPDGGPGPNTWSPPAAYPGFGTVGLMSGGPTLCAPQTAGAGAAE